LFNTVPKSGETQQFRGAANITPGFPFLNHQQSGLDVRCEGEGILRRPAKAEGTGSAGWPAGVRTLPVMSSGWFRGIRVIRSGNIRLELPT